MSEPAPMAVNGNVPSRRGSNAAPTTARVPHRRGGRAADRRRPVMRWPPWASGCHHDPDRLSARPACLRARPPTLGHARPGAGAASCHPAQEWPAERAHRPRQRAARPASPAARAETSLPLPVHYRTARTDECRRVQKAAGRDRDRRRPSPSIRICGVMLAASRSPMGGTIPAPSRSGSGIATSSTPPATPSSPPIGSGISGSGRISKG